MFGETEITGDTTRKEEEKKREFERVAIPHMLALYNSARLMVVDPRDAEDLVQDTYLRAYRFFGTFTRDISFKAWLYKIFNNLWINKHRSSLRVPSMIDYEVVELSGVLRSEATPETEIFDKLLDEEVINALDELPAKFRSVIILFDLEDFSYQEISEILSCPVGTVMSRLYRGRKILRGVLGDYAKKRGYRGA